MSAKVHVPAIAKSVSREWLTIGEFRSLVDCHSYQVYRWVYRGDLPVYVFFRGKARIHMPEMNTPNDPTEDSHNFMSIKEFADWVRVAEVTVRRAIAHPTNPIPHIRIGGLVRIDRDLAIAQARHKASIRGWYKKGGVPKYILKKDMP